MALNNKDKVIVKNIVFCKTVLKKTIGLMFHKKITGQALVFIFKKESIVSLHMFFVFFPIDVLFLDKNKKVVEIKEKFKPFTFYNPKKKAKYVIELPNNTIKRTNTLVGDTLSF